MYQKVLRRQHEKIGYSTIVANHGIEALDVIHDSDLWRGSRSNDTKRLPPQVILMDVEMPMMDGRECVKRIRQYESQNLLSIHVPVIALTANARAEQIMDVKQCGFDDVITKPFQIEQIVRKILFYTNRNTV